MNHRNDKNNSYEEETPLHNINTRTPLNTKDLQEENDTVNSTDQELIIHIINMRSSATTKKHRKPPES